MVGRPQSSELVELIARMERIENEAREVIAEKAGGSEQPISAYSRKFRLRTDAKNNTPPPEAASYLSL
jgi:hypothetical protein